MPVTTHEASCSCGQLTAIAQGDPVRVSACFCLACQRRTGSSFSAQARWARENVRTTGESREYVRVSDEGDERRFHFCPSCGGTVFFVIPDDPELIAIPVGALADPAFPGPTAVVYEDRRHPWADVTPRSA
jgi:hypothetical protein